jgi:unsaturated chondroitin disaccharide hydrolase
MPPPRTALLGVVLLLVLAAPPASAAPAGWEETAAGIAAPWPALQGSNGHFADYVVRRSPSADRDDYGDAMLGYGLLLRAARTGDVAARDAGLRAIGYALDRPSDPANAPFRFVALAGGYNVARAAFADAPLFTAARSRWEAVLRRAEARRLGRTEVTNKSLVEAVAILELTRTGLKSSRRGAVLNDPDAALALVRRLLARELPRAAQKFSRASGRAGRTAMIGDFSGAPLAYHGLATGFLARAIELMGRSAPDEARRVLRRAVDASWAFAGPDGDLSYFGRSQEQAWTLPLTAFAAETAGGARGRALSTRAIDRLGSAYRTGSEGLFVTPALGQDVRLAIAGLDPYVAAVSYNGLTLVALDWAIGAARGDGAPGGEIGSDRDGSFVVARGTRTFATVRRGDVWFAVKQARSDPADLRYDFGLVALKVRDEDGVWRTLPLRPRARETAGPVLGGGGLPEGRRLSVARDGTVSVAGGFRTAAGRWLRKGVRFRFAPTRCGVRLSLPARRRDVFRYSAWFTQDPSIRGGRLVGGDQVVTTTPGSGGRIRRGYASGLDARLVRDRLRFAIPGRRLAIEHCLAARSPRPAARGRKAAPGSIVADDLSLPLASWQRAGRVKLRNGGGRYRRSLELTGSGRITRPLVSGLGAMSLDVNVPRGAALDVRLGGARLTLTKRMLGSAGWHRLELAGGRIAVDGRTLKKRVALRGPLSLRARRGTARVAALIATRKGDRAALILHRLAALHARTPLGRYPYGTGRGPSGELRFSDGWTTGFWPGSLWRAYDLSGRSRLFRNWALATTLEHMGNEGEQVHDQGFRYLESSAAAHDRLCESSRSKTCSRLRASALRAADTLLRLQRGNPGAGTIPTLPAGERCRDCASKNEAETIVDSMMNVSLIEWAHGETGRASYRDAALEHARGVARLLVRDDGSTAQAVRLNRRTGGVIETHTHQGIGATSTWARGQAWAVYGFAYSGAALEDAELVRVSERAAGYVAANLPRGGIPPYDYSARGGRPVDTSAGVITAAGLFRLADACAAVAASCEEPDRWRPLAERMLAASLTRVSQGPPLGFLGDQVFTRGGSARWDDNGEFIFGTDYALEAAVR